MDPGRDPGTKEQEIAALTRGAMQHEGFTVSLPSTRLIPQDKGHLGTPQASGSIGQDRPAGQEVPFPHIPGLPTNGTRCEGSPGQTELPRSWEKHPPP